MLEQIWNFLTSDTGRNLFVVLGAAVGIAWTLYRFYGVSRRRTRIPHPPSQSDTQVHSPNELAFVTTLSDAYVRQDLEGIVPEHATLATDEAVARELTKLNREKDRTESHVITLPIACPLFNPLTHHVFDLFEKKKLQKYLPQERIPWKYELRFASYIYSDEPIPEVAADPYPRYEYSSDPKRAKLERIRNASENVLRETCDALIVSVLSALHLLFLERSLDFKSRNHVAEAASALSKDANVSRTVVNLAVLMMIGGRGPRKFPIWVPKDHSVARIIQRLLSTELPNMIPTDLHTITVPGINMKAALPPTLPEEIRASGFPIDYLEELLALRDKPRPRLTG